MMGRFCPGELFGAEFIFQSLMGLESQYPEVRLDAGLVAGVQGRDGSAFAEAEAEIA